MCRLHGTHTTPPETAVVPPICSALSRISTSAPPSAARAAAVSAAPPDPTTTTSLTRSQPATVGSLRALAGEAPRGAAHGRQQYPIPSPGGHPGNPRVDQAA